MKGIILYPWK